MCPDPASKPNDGFSPLDLTRLEYLWLHSDCRTLKEFAEKRGLDPKPFIQRAKGWRARRAALRSRGEGVVLGGLEARAHILKLWWRVLEELSISLEPGCDEARLKTLGTAAGILKVAHAGVGNLVNLGDDSPLTPIVIEGLHVDTL